MEYARQEIRDALIRHTHALLDERGGRIADKRLYNYANLDNYINSALQRRVGENTMVTVQHLFDMQTDFCTIPDEIKDEMREETKAVFSVLVSAFARVAKDIDDKKIVAVQPPEKKTVDETETVRRAPPAPKKRGTRVHDYGKPMKPYTPRPEGEEPPAEEPAPKPRPKPAPKVTKKKTTEGTVARPAKKISAEDAAEQFETAWNDMQKLCEDNGLRTGMKTLASIPSMEAAKKMKPKKFKEKMDEALKDAPNFEIPVRQLNPLIDKLQAAHTQLTAIRERE